MSIAALRAAGVFDKFVFGTTPPSDASQLWVDQNQEPPVVRRFDDLQNTWVGPISQDDFFRASGITFAGDWSAGETYKRSVVVTNRGSSFICTTDHVGAGANEPGVGSDQVNFWSIMAAGNGQFISELPTVSSATLDAELVVSDPNLSRISGRDLRSSYDISPEHISTTSDRIFRSHLSSVIEDDMYCHFPIGLSPKNGRYVVFYHKGRNHGQSDVEAVCFPQALGSAGNLIINGNEAENGVATIKGTNPLGTRVTISSTGDDSGVTFSITGQVNGATVTESVTGSNAASSLSTNLFQSVQSVSSDGATSGDVTVGFFNVPGDIRMAISDDFGGTWTISTIGDGQTEGRLRYYSVVGGQVTPDEGIALLQMVSETQVSWVVRKTTDSFDTLSDEHTVTLDFTPTGAFFFYGNVKSTADGRYLVGAYDSAGGYVMVSNDGVSWTRIFNEQDSSLKEPSVLALDIDTILVVFRVQGASSSLRVFRTLNGGISWMDLGGTNLPVSGGYVSPQLGSIVTSAGLEGILLAAERQTTSGTANPNSIISRYGRYDDIDTSATGWSNATRVLGSFAVDDWVTSTAYVKDVFAQASDGQTYRALTSHTSSSDSEPNVGANWQNFWTRFNTRGGYPTHYLSRLSGQGWLAWGVESGYRRSAIVFNQVDFKEISIGDYFGQSAPFSPSLLGTTSGSAEPSYTNRIGRFGRSGNRVWVAGSITVNGAITVTGTLEIGNLPYNNSVTGGVILGQAVASNLSSGISSAFLDSATDGSTFEIRHLSATTFSNLISTEVEDNFRIDFTANYETND